MGIHLSVLAVLAVLAVLRDHGALDILWVPWGHVYNRKIGHRIGKIGHRIGEIGHVIDDVTDHMIGHNIGQIGEAYSGVCGEGGVVVDIVVDIVVVGIVVV